MILPGAPFLVAGALLGASMLIAASAVAAMNRNQPAG